MAKLEWEWVVGGEVDEDQGVGIGHGASPLVQAAYSARLGVKTSRLITASSPTTCSASAELSTSAAGDLVVAFVAGGGPAGGGQSSVVSGGGLTWTLSGRENGQPGTAEVWTARASGVLSKAQITATLKKTGYDEAIALVAFKNSAGAGNVVGFNRKTGAPTGTLTTSRPNSWVFAVGDDPHAALPRTVGAGQTLIAQAFDSGGNTYWLQAAGSPTSIVGTPVTINDTAPASDPYNLLLVEIL